MTDMPCDVQLHTLFTCSQKWVLQLSWSQAGSPPVKWSAQDNLKLVHTLSCLDVEDEEEVDRWFYSWMVKF